jgi:spore coat protein CotH
MTSFCIYAQGLSNIQKLYDDSEIAVIKIEMDPSDYSYMISHPREDALSKCTVYFKNAFIDDTLKNSGIRIRGNTSRDSKKKSFKISFDDYEPGREFYGVDKLNLNGEHNDPSMSRAKFCWDIFQQIGAASSRAAHAAVYINGNFHGVYISVENIDREFLKRNYSDASGNLWKCLYPADLTYKGDNPIIYQYQQNFPAYELETNKDKYDYSQLARLIKIVNKTETAHFADSLESILFVHEFIRYHAINILLGSWDDYWSVMNNFYLYLDPAAKKFHWIPYDYDNSLGVDFAGIDWSGTDPYNSPQVVSGSRPLLTNILSVSEYRNLYTRFLSFYSLNVTNLQNMELGIERIKNLVASYADDDTYRTLDYGFTFTDFLNSFSSGYAPPSKMGIKQFIAARSGNIINKLKYVTADPIVYNIEYEIKNDSVFVYASAFDNEGLSSIIINYSSGDISNTAAMKYAPVKSFRVEDADRWTGSFPLIKNNDTIYIKIEAIDKSQNMVSFPRTDYIKIKPVPPSLAGSVVINEILADNEGITSDPSGENEDFVELYNSAEQAIILSGMYLTDNSSNPVKWQFTQPNLALEPGEFLVVWCDEDTDQEGVHVGFKLSKEGEFIGLVAADGITWLDSISFGVQAENISFARIPDGGSAWAFSEPTPGQANIISGVEEDKQIPQSFYAAAYPNPFNPVTNIEFNLPGISDVKVAVYDILGRETWSVSEQGMRAGKHILTWNAADNSGTKLSTGVYLCRVIAKEYSAVIKLMLIK